MRIRTKLAELAPWAHKPGPMRTGLDVMVTIRLALPALDEKERHHSASSTE